MVIESETRKRSDKWRRTKRIRPVRREEENQTGGGKKQTKVGREDQTSGKGKESDEWGEFFIVSLC